MKDAIIRLALFDVNTGRFVRSWLATSWTGAHYDWHRVILVRCCSGCFCANCLPRGKTGGSQNCVSTFSICISEYTFGHSTDHSVEMSMLDGVPQTPLRMSGRHRHKRDFSRRVRFPDDSCCSAPQTLKDLDMPLRPEGAATIQPRAERSGVSCEAPPWV